MDLKGFKCGWLDAGTSQSDDGPIGFPVRSSQSNLSLACLFERTRKLIEVNLSMFSEVGIRSLTVLATTWARQGGHLRSVWR